MIRVPRWTLWLRQNTRRYDDFTHRAFVQKLHLQILPNDEEHREGFDTPTDFRIGDPNVHFHAAAAKPYETSGATGKPEWASLFGFILARMSHLRFLSTVYVLVDNRNLTNRTILNLLCNTGLLLRPGGPAVLACRVLPRSAVTLSTSPLAKPVVSIWFTPLGPAPFVLAALAWSFRVYTLCCLIVIVYQSRSLRLKICGKNCGFPGPVPTSSCAGGLNFDPANPTLSSKLPKEQEVILVTEHNAEVNAGFVVLRGSNHAPPLEADWQSIFLGPGDMQDRAIGKYRQRLVSAYWQLVSKMVSHGRDDRDMTPTKCQAWIQSGHIMNTSLEWAVAWSLVGEWTTRTIFLPRKGEWPRQGHPKALISPSWARACSLPGEASLLVLFGDGMFQAQRIVNGKCRPVILHG